MYNVELQIDDLMVTEVECRVKLIGKQCKQIQNKKKTNKVR